MIIYPELKLISIRVPGTGSTPFHEEMLRKHEHYSVTVEPGHPSRKMNNIHMVQHFTAEQARSCIRKGIWDSYEKISFVRHPFWWARSIYRKLDTLNMIGINNKGSFEKFLSRLDKTPYFWFTDQSGNVIIDTIYRTEDLSKVFVKYDIRYKHSNHSPTKRELEITAGVAPLLLERFSREYEHYDRSDIFGEAWGDLNKPPAKEKRR